MLPGASVSSFDAGNRRMRRKVLGRPPTPLNMELELSFATLPIFDNFVEFDLNMGTLPFTAPVLLPSGFVVPRTCQFLSDENGMVPLRWTRRRVARPAFTLLVWNWRGYEDETRSYLSALTSPVPDDPRKVLYNAVIAGLKEAGIWSKISVLHLYANLGAQAARRNLKDPAVALATGAGSPTPTLQGDRGYLGDGSQAYLDLGIGYSSIPGISIDNHSVFVWSLTDGADPGREAGNLTGNGTSIGILNGGTMSVRANSPTQFNVANNTGLGLFGFSRRSNLIDLYRNGTLLATQTEAPTSFGSGNITVLRGPTLYSARRIAAYVCAQGLSSAEVASLYAVLRTYLVAIGAVS